MIKFENLTPRRPKINKRAGTWLWPFLNNLRGKVDLSLFERVHVLRWGVLKLILIDNQIIIRHKLIMLALISFSLDRFLLCSVQEHSAATSENRAAALRIFILKFIFQNKKKVREKLYLSIIFYEC